MALKEWNIPRQSVTLLASGPAANRLIALSTGALDATLHAPPETGEATYQFMTNKEKALAMYNRRLKQKNPSVVEETYQYFAATFSFPPPVSHDGRRGAMEMIAKRTPGAKMETNVEKYVDERLLDELEREGLFKRISGKG